jgi:hypothetical protein
MQQLSMYYRAAIEQLRFAAAASAANSSTDAIFDKCLIPSLPAAASQRSAMPTADLQLLLSQRKPHHCHQRQFPSPSNSFEDDVDDVTTDSLPASPEMSGQERNLPSAVNEGTETGSAPASASLSPALTAPSAAVLPSTSFSIDRILGAATRNSKGQNSEHRLLQCTSLSAHNRDMATTGECQSALKFVDVGRCDLKNSLIAGQLQQQLTSGDFYGGEDLFAV